MIHFRRLARYLVRYWRLQALALLATAAASGLNLLIPLFLMFLIDRVIGEGQTDMLAPLFISFLAVLVLQGLSTIVRDYLFARTAQFVLRDLRADLARCILRWPYSAFSREPAGQIMARVQSDAANIHGLMSTVFVASIADIISLLVVGMIVFSLNWRLSLITLVCLPAFLGAFVFFRRRMAAAGLRTQVATAGMSEELQGMVMAIKEIKSQWGYRLAERRFGTRLAALAQAALGQNLLQSVTGVAIAFIGMLAPLVVLWAGTLEILAGRLTVGQLVAFNSYLTYIFGPSQRLASVNINLQVALVSAGRVFEYLDRPSEPEEGRTPARLRRGEVVLEGVRFAYVPGRDVLSGIDLTVHAGSRAALVGPSGCGKSTVADLLVGLYRPQSGTILVDGRDHARIRLSSLRLQIACVPQEPVLFKGTIGENIAFSRPGASPADIEELSRLLGIDGFAGLSDEVGERGVTLSLGQRQRIGIARALVKRPVLLVLDEATSGLDPQSEKLVWSAVSDRMGGGTVLLITHRLLSVTGMEDISVLTGGVIVERGGHGQLMARAGTYCRMFTEQFRKQQAQA